MQEKQGSASSSLLVDGGREWNAAQRTAVRQEIDRVLAHPTFKTSHRCTALLQYVVRAALSEQEDEIKERTLGIKVFGREASYDVGADPIVRRVANEVRKRLALYNQEDTHPHAVKIHLPRGGYLAEFEFCQETTSPLESEALAEPATERMEALLCKPPSSAPEERPSAVRAHLLRNKQLFAIPALLLAAAGLYLCIGSPFNSPLKRLWKPFLEAGKDVIVCLPDDSQLHKGPAPARMLEAPHDLPASMLFRDVEAGGAVTTLLTRMGKRTEMRSSSTLSYQDFQREPVVLIGGLNNPWVPALLSKLRYSVHFQKETRERWIEDAQAPADRRWSIRNGPESTPPAEDYAVITRIYNEETGQWLLALSGLEGYATQAAGEFVVSRSYAAEIPRRIREAGNFQIVLRTTLAGNEPGPVQIVALYTW